MIVRSSVVALCLFFFYNALLGLKSLRKQFAVQSQWQENIVKAQEYPLMATPKPGVIVGSSLSAKLAGTALEDACYNLSFSAEGPFTGLEIVRRHPITPRVVFIETNLLVREENRTVVDGAFRPVISDLRPYLPALRERYQPANLISGGLGVGFVSQLVKIKQQFWPVPRSAQQRKEGEKPLFKQSLAMKITQYNVPAKAEVIKRHTSEMKASVSDLERRGARCVFVEMPVDQALLALPRSTQVRDALKEPFPPFKYVWIGPEEGRRYVTTDGVHLAKSEAIDFAQRLRAELERAESISWPD